MRRLLALALLLAAAAVPAAAAEPPTGPRCGWNAVGTDGDTGTTWTGILRGGPVAVPGAAATLTCTVHVGNDSPTGPAAGTVTGTGSGVVAAAGPVTVTAPDWEVVAICSVLTVDGATWYGTATGWTPLATAPCGHSSAPTSCWDITPLDCAWPYLQPVYDALPPEAQQEVSRLFCEVYWGIECQYWPDGLICPELRGLPGGYGPLVVAADGDVFVNGELEWDCPPYQVWE